MLLVCQYVMVMREKPNLTVPFASQTRKKFIILGSPAPKNKETRLGALYRQTSKDLVLPNPDLLGKWKHAVGAAWDFPDHS